MEASLPLLFAGFVGFSHAFEADHLVAVSNIVTRRDKLALAVKDGIYWGLGHTSTILLIGLIIIVGKTTFLNGYFGYFEAGVGLMLVVLGIYRLYKHYNTTTLDMDESDNHHLAYGIGLIHGLAGSGAMVLLVMSQIQSEWNSIIYLVIFGVGSIVGMLLAAGVLVLPFAKKRFGNVMFQRALIFASSALCIGYGGYVMFENLM